MSRRRQQRALCMTPSKVVYRTIEAAREQYKLESSYAYQRSRARPFVPAPWVYRCGCGALHRSSYHGHSSVHVLSKEAETL